MRFFFFCALSETVVAILLFEARAGVRAEVGFESKSIIRGVSTRRGGGTGNLIAATFCRVYGHDAPCCSRKLHLRSDHIEVLGQSLIVSTRRPAAGINPNRTAM